MGPAPDVRRFLCLPASALAFPFVHARGRGAGHVRWETAALSAMAWLWKRSRGHAGTFSYRNGVTVEISDQEFVASIEGIADVLWTRFYRKTLPTAPTARYKAHYEAVRLAVLQLQKTDVDGVPLLCRLGPARTDKPGKASDLFGQRWTMEGSVVDRELDGLGACGSPGVLFYDDTEKLYREIIQWSKQINQGDILAGTEYAALRDNNYVQQSSIGSLIIDGARVYDALTAWDFRLPGLMVEAAAKVGCLHWRERPVNPLTFQRRRARGKGWGGAHLTVGVWQKGQATSRERQELACTVPFLVADVDGQGLEDSFVVVRLLLDRLVELGVRPNDLVVSYTGGRGFHVRIPHGLIGRPLWPRAGDVKPVLGRFFERLCDGLTSPDGPLVNSLDSSLFTPLHLVRVVGSEYEKVPGHWCVAYRGDDFLRLCLDLDDGVLDIVEAQSASLQRPWFSFLSPDRSAPVPALDDMLRAAVRDVEERALSVGAPSGNRESRGIIAAIQRGVLPSEQFAPGHAGRNKAAYLLTLNLLTNGRLDKARAWAALKQWNAVNPVPLGAAEGDDSGELERVFNRACDYVACNSGSDAGWTSASPS